MSRPIQPGNDTITIFLAGDVMTGRGIDQILPHPGAPELREGWMEHAADYVELARRAHGPVPAPVDFSYIWGEALTVLEQVQPNVAVANLETGVTESSDFWPRKAVHYRMHPDNVSCLQAAGIDVWSLANNHMLDFGRSGLEETIEVLERADMIYVGAGRSLEQASRPVRIPVADNTAVVIYAFGTESSGIPRDWAAGPSRSGVNLLPDLSLATVNQIIEHIHDNRQDDDITIASIHWGSNWGHEVPPAHVDFAHALLHGGVDLLHGHSSHHVRPVEVHDGKLILYGTGDLITDYEGISGNEEWRGDLGAMYFATLSIRDHSLVELRAVPMQLRRLQLVRAEADDQEWLADTINWSSERFGTRFELDSDGVLVMRAPLL